MKLSKSNTAILVEAVLENKNINHIGLLNCDASLVNAIKKVKEKRSEVKITEALFPTKKLNPELEPKHNSALFCGLSMHVVQGFISLVGIGLVAVAFVAFNAATLNPAGIALAATGTAAFLLSTYGLFVNNSNEREDPSVQQAETMQPTAP